MKNGIVIKNTGSWYYVEDKDSGNICECKLKGKLRLKDIRTTNPIAVGDTVFFDTDETGSNVIWEIEERKNYIIRRSSNLSKEAHIIAANVDTAFVVATLNFPITSTEFIDRFLVTAEAYNIPAVVILNKCDLYTHEDYQPILEDFRKIYESAGYPVIEVSATEGTNINYLREYTRNKINLFSGNSGVGKSTLINAVDKTLTPKTGDISLYHNKGKHTTTFSEMFKMKDGGYIIDTPGIKSFGLVDVEKNEVGKYFPEIFKFSSNCQYYNCTHTHEPGCCVKKAIENVSIAEERYISYLKLLEDNNQKYR
ncbi:MAG: ribosome small subunit-dependent GTPase A [Rikenellaceae bacterium]|nr:ribosome small subunit-dependent GTPase A [Rikenellaceae bacterium]